MKNLKKHEQAALNDAASLFAFTKKAPHPTNLSEIAARLRQVHGQMQQGPLNGAHGQNYQTLRAHLNEISRALLAEHYDRREWQTKLLARLEQIEQLQKKLTEEKDNSVSALKLAKIEEIIEKAALKSQNEMPLARQSIELQKGLEKPPVATEQTAQAQKNSAGAKAQDNNKEKHFFGQFMALQDQIAHIQQRLNESDKKPNQSVIYQMADLPIEKMTDIVNSKIKIKENTKKKKKSFFTFSPVKFIATILTLVVIYGLYFQFRALLSDLSLLHL